MLLDYYVVTLKKSSVPGTKEKATRSDWAGSFASSLDEYKHTGEINKFIKYLLDNYFITITADNYENPSKFYLRNNETETVYTVLDGVSHSKIDANNLKIEDALSILCSECKIPEEKIPTCIKELDSEFDKKRSMASIVSSAASTSTESTEHSDSESPRTSKSFKR